MKSDIYTKAVLTVIGIMLTVIAIKPLINPEVAVSAQSSKFGKYLQPVAHPDMDFIELEANLDTVLNAIPLQEGFGVPEIHFNYKENRPEAVVHISPEFEKNRLDVIKLYILSKYSATFTILKGFIPELTEDDFTLQIVRLQDPNHRLFAECTRGNIVFH